MEIIFATSKDAKVRIKSVGKTLNLLTMLIAIGKCLAEKLSKEKEINLEDAERIIIDCISESIKTVKNIL